MNKTLLCGRSGGAALFSGVEPADHVGAVDRLAVAVVLQPDAAPSNLGSTKIHHKTVFYELCIKP